MDGFDYVHAKPMPELIKAGLPAGFKSYALGVAGKEYGVYLGRLGGKDKPEPGAEQTASLQLGLPDGNYKIQWVNVLTGEKTSAEAKSSAGLLELKSPTFRDDVAFTVRK